MSRLSIFLAFMCSALFSLHAAAPGGEAERGYQAAILEYRRDEERLPRLIHYQQVSGGVKGESVRREAWVAEDGSLVKAVEELRGPQGSELIETSLSGVRPYFIFHQKTTLLADGSVRVEEERKYRHEGKPVRWTKRGATFRPDADIDLKRVKQEPLPLAKLPPGTTSAEAEAAQAILKTLRAAVKPAPAPMAKP